MGMFNDYRSPNREGWKYSYTGAKLYPFAAKKYDYFTQQELAARTEMSAKLLDPNVRASDPKIEDLKTDIEKFGSEREKCLVWMNEFYNRPEELYSLALGDVTYFDIFILQ